MRNGLDILQRCYVSRIWRVEKGYLLNNMTESPRKRKLFFQIAAIRRWGYIFSYEAVLSCEGDCYFAISHLAKDKLIKTVFAKANTARNTMTYRIIFTAQKDGFTEIVQVNESS